MGDHRLGKKPAVQRPRDFKFAQLLADAGITLPPASSLPGRFGHGNIYPGGAWGMLGNDQYGDCVARGQRVLMADGTTKPIEEVQVLDRVATHEGNACAVLGTRAKPWVGEIINVKLYGNNLLHVTEDHKLLTRRGWIRAGHLRLDDWLYQPRVAPEHRSDSIETHRYLDQRMVIRKQGRSTRRSNGSVTTITTLPETISLTEEFGTLIGFFLAEGSTNQNVVRWTFGIHERDTLARECTNALDTLGISWTTADRKNNTRTVTVCGRHWREVFARLCGRGAGEKRLHADLLAGPDEFRRAVLDGWMRGDGHARRGERTGRTVSHELALDMVQIGLSLNTSPVIRTEHRTPRPPVKTTQRNYDVTIRDEETGGHGMVERTTNGVWRRIRALASEEYVDYVFDISVDEDHSFICESVAVHNCVMAGSAHEHMMINHVVHRTDIPFSDASVLGDYGAVTGFTPNDPNSDQGTVVADALAYRRKTGIADAHGTRHKIGAYVALDAKSWDHLRLAVYFFGAVGIGFECPDNLFAQFDAGVPWDVDGKRHQIIGGHYVPVVGEPNSGKVAVITWAQRQEMTRAYYEKYCDEAWVYFTSEELNSHGLGLHAQLVSTLNSYLSQLGG